MLKEQVIEANEFGEAYQSGIYCSECGETLGCEANFCPNCGADMREGAELDCELLREVCHILKELKESEEE